MRAVQGVIGSWQGCLGVLGLWPTSRGVQRQGPGGPGGRGGSISDPINEELFFFRDHPNRTGRVTGRRQPGIWRRKFLLEGGADGGAALMQPDENPWLNELFASRRIEAHHARVALIPLDWYVAVSSGGELNELGRLMVAMSADGSLEPVDLEVGLNVNVRRG